MKAQIKSRPESKRIRQASSRQAVRPTSRHVNTDQARNSFLQGKEHQGEDRFQKAIELYIKATMYDPNYYQAYCNIGACYRSLKLYTDSRKFYKKAIAIKPDDAISRYNLGNVQRLLGNYEQSVKHYKYVINLKEEKGIDVGNLYLNSLINLGISFKCSDLFEKAAQCYEKALKMSPNEQSASFNFGMCIVSSLNCIDKRVFHQVTKEQATKAFKLFKKVCEMNKESQMAEFQMKRMSVLMDSSPENIKKKVEEMKKLQKKDNCTLNKEIELQIGSCMKLLKDFEASDKHFRQSLGNQFGKKPSSKNIYDGAGAYPSEQIQLTEEEGLKMIEEGRYEEVRVRVNNLPDSDMAKHVLSLTLELSILNQSQDEANLDIAKQIYESRFKKAGQKIPMESISLAGHKAIGHLLSLQKKYNESIEHFEFVGSKIKSEQEKSAVHSSLGNDYEAIGEINKAVEEYKIALQSQPDSFQLNYNIGCCFFDQQNYEEAMRHFQKFLELINKDPSVKMDTKNIYIADCLISMTGCASHMETDKKKTYELYLRAWNSVKQVRDLCDLNFEFEEEKMETFYSTWAEILEERLDAATDKKSESYLADKEILLEVYVCLLSHLENSQSVDRDVILSNCATIYYEEKLYVNALANFNQMNGDEMLSFNNLALTYLHLHEHYMANRYITEAAQDSLDVIETFNKGVILWIYGFSDQTQSNQQLLEQFKNKSDAAMLNRLEYGKMLIDAVTFKISQLTPGYTIQQLKNTIYKTERTDLNSLVEQGDQSKLKALVQELSRPAEKTSNTIDPILVESCVQASNDPEKALEGLIKKCMDTGKDMSQGVFQSLLNLFIFIHRPAVFVESIKKVFKRYSNQSIQNLAIDFDRRVTMEEELKSKQFGVETPIKSIGDLIAHVISWESELESKLVIILKTIEKYYYKSTFKRPMEFEYHFPRHANWTECSITYNKIAYLVMLLCPSLQIQLKGSTLPEINNSIFQQLEDGLIKKIKNKESLKIGLSQKFVPLTIYAFFHNKQDCLQFLKEIQKESSKKCELNANKQSREIRVMVSGILRLVCSWEQPNYFLNVIKSYNEHLLPIEVQAVISLEDDLQTLRESSQKVSQVLAEVKALQ